MSNSSLPARRRKASTAESWPVLWRVTMPAPEGDTFKDWIWEETSDEALARRRCTSLRRAGWPVRLERIQQQPLLDSAAAKVETMRAQHERHQNCTPAH